MAKDKSASSNPPAAGGLEPPGSTGGQAPPQADARSAQSTPGQEPGVTKQTKKLRKEAESLRERLRAAEKDRDELMKSQQSDAERDKALLAKLQAESLAFKQKERQWLVKQAVAEAVDKRGIDRNLTEMVERLLNGSEDIRFDEESGKLKGVGKALDGLLEAYPILKSLNGQSQQPSIGATNPQQTSVGATKGGDPLNPPRLSDVLPWPK